MLFRLVIWLLSQQIGKLMRSDPDFRYAVREKNLVLQFALQNGEAVRYLDFDRGVYRTSVGWHEAARQGNAVSYKGKRVATFSFASAWTGLMLLIKGSKDSGVMLAAMREKTLIVKGDFTLFIWFGWLADQL